MYCKIIAIILQFEHDKYLSIRTHNELISHIKIMKFIPIHIHHSNNVAQI